MKAEVMVSILLGAGILIFGASAITCWKGEVTKTYNCYWDASYLFFTSLLCLALAKIWPWGGV